MSELDRSSLQLKHLFWATALIAAGLGLHWQTIGCSLLVIAAWVAVFRSQVSLGKLLEKIAVVVVLILIALMLIPSVQISRIYLRSTECRNNIRNVQIAILNYESVYGRFPSDTVEVNSSGERIRTSWRVHILPFLEANEIYEKYRFDEPWDSPKNTSLMQNASYPWGYIGCPSVSDPNKTPYKLVVGKGTAFDRDKVVRLEDFKDGTSNTILVVEDFANPIEYSKPEDLTVSEAVDLFNNSSKKNCAHFDEDFWTTRYTGFHYALADGTSHRWPVNPRTKIDAGAFMIADGKRFNPLTNSRQLAELRWGRVVSLVVYILLCLYPIAWLKRHKPDHPEVIVVTSRS